jgi:cell division control protein 24
MLRDRIDAKLSHAHIVSISSGQVKLKYVDEVDFISISSDNDVQEAFNFCVHEGGGPAVVQLFFL